MAGPAHAPALVPALATGIGSLPHDDPHVAADLVLRHHPRLPAAPQLPARSPLEGLVAQWARALPEVSVGDDGEVVVDVRGSYAPPEPVFDPEAHGGLLAFLDAAASVGNAPPERVKVQIAGPLTLGLALNRAGMPTERAFRRGAEAARSWAIAVEELVETRLPGSSLVLFFDEPALVLWRRHAGVLDREAATDLLSGALAAPGCMTGVHVCGAGDRRLALEAGPQVIGVEVDSDLIEDADVISRHLDADGWVAWGAVPTDRPVGESVEPLWRGLVTVWCELTRRGCDPVRLRTQALVTPACGLANHGRSQAERALRLARAVADRVHDQAVAARLTLGA
jgi:Cobalamin-independent synthase, Catalytic domain